MSQVETVALWVGLLAGVVGIALSVVAIVFSWVVNQRAGQISDETIRALQKIESTVERMSQDTSGLIKVAWDRLIVSSPLAVPQLNADSSESSSQTKVAEVIASGLSAELRDELAEARDSPTGRSQSSPEMTKNINEIVDRLQRLMETQLASQGTSNPSELFDHVYAKIRALPPIAVELLRQMSHYGHFTRDAYRALVQSKLIANPLSELREAGFVTPLAHGTDGERVYWFPPNTQSYVKQALLMAPVASKDVQELVHHELHRVKYFQNPEGPKSTDGTGHPEGPDGQSS